MPVDLSRSPAHFDPSSMRIGFSLAEHSVRRYCGRWFVLSLLGLWAMARLDAQYDSRALDRKRDIERIVQDIHECRQFGGVLVLWEKFLGSTFRGHVRTLDRHLERDSTDLEARYLRGLLNDYLDLDDEAAKSCKIGQMNESVGRGQACTSVQTLHSRSLRLWR
jgi:hypothetical protein